MLFKKPGGVNWLIVFLGNPGVKYEGTRHNAGFMTADVMAKNKGVAINRLRFKALTAQCTIGGESVLLMKPQTYMNLSGEAVEAHLGTEEFPRIRLGVGEPPHPDYDVKDWVLSTFKNQDAEDMARAAEHAAAAAECYITEGPEKAMNKFNNK